MPTRSLARWIALAASCLSLAGWAAPTWETPRAERPVAAVVVGKAVRPVRAAATVASAEKPRPPRVQARPHVPAGRPRPQAARPLYLLHRALLR